MDTSTLHDHVWDAPVGGAAPAEAGAATVEAATTRVDRHAPAETRSGFRVLSLEQYAASHARSVHQVRDS